jgi:hypothetical protein
MDINMKRVEFLTKWVLHMILFIEYLNTSISVDIIVGIFLPITVIVVQRWNLVLAMLHKKDV